MQKATQSKEKKTVRKTIRCRATIERLLSREQFQRQIPTNIRVQYAQKSELKIEKFWEAETERWRAARKRNVFHFQ